MKTICGINIKLENGIRYLASCREVIDCGERTGYYEVAIRAVSAKGKRIGRWEATHDGLTRSRAEQFVVEFNGPSGSPIVWQESEEPLFACMS